MINILAFLIRKISIILVTNEVTYYPGMIMIRLGRWLRKKVYIDSNKTDFQTVALFNGAKIYLDRFTYMGGSIFWTGFHHLTEALYLNTILRSNMTFIDVGANQGEFSLIAASIINSGKILSFEPVSQQRTLLEKNKVINNFQQIEIYPFGLGNKNSELPIYTSANTSLHHGRHEGLSSLYFSSERNILQEIIQIKVFDDLFFNDLDRLDFIKIDIEGAELFALQGMSKSIQKFKPTILIEINEETFNSANYSTKDVLEFFYNFGYNFFEIKKGKLVNIEVKSFEKWGNYIAQCKK